MYTIENRLNWIPNIRLNIVKSLLFSYFVCLWEPTKWTLPLFSINNNNNYREVLKRLRGEGEERRESVCVVEKVKFM